MKNFFLVFVLTISINSIPAAQQNIITNLSGDVPAKILAQVSFSGKVTDASTNEPLVGASIYFADLKTGAASNENGFFVINNINAGRYLVEVSHLGYTSIIETITITGDTKKDFAMSIAVIENDAVTVTGVSSATSTRRTPIPVSIMRKEQLFQSGAANLIDNISRIPGVAQVSTGPAISKPFIRGLGYNRVMVMNDGVKQEGQQWGDEHGIEIDEQNVNKIEVLKGPASLMYGSDALAGVINIVSFVPAYEGKVNGNLSSAYFGNNRQRNLHGAINSNKNGLVWGLYGSLKAAADYKNKYDGYVYNSKFKEKDFGGYIGINRKWGYSHLYVTRFDQELGLVEGDRDTVTGKFLKQINENGIEAETLATRNDFLGTEPAIPRQRVQHNKIVFDNNFHVGDNRLTVILGLQQNQRQEFGNVIETNEKNLWFDLKTFNYTVQYHLAEKKDWKTTIGANGMAQSNTNKGIEQLIPAYHIFDIGSFVHTQKKLGKVTLSGGFRLDNRHLNTQQLIDGNILKFSALQKNFTNWSGSAGLHWRWVSKLPSSLILLVVFERQQFPSFLQTAHMKGLTVMSMAAKT